MTVVRHEDSVGTLPDGYVTHGSERQVSGVARHPGFIPLRSG